MSLLSVALPPPPGSTEVPIWTGTEFRLGAARQRVLAFERDQSGWSEDLFKMHQALVGGDHFIDVASRRHALAELDRWLPGTGGIILEVGCSGGYFLDALVKARPAAEIIGADYTTGALEQLGRRLTNVPLLQFDLTQCPLPDASVDAVVLLNVLEHIENDAAAVAQLHRILRPGGVVIVEVPAGSSLFDIYDSHLMHFRRYDMSNLLALMRRGGFEILAHNHLGFLLFPPFWATKKLNRMRPPADPAKTERRVQAAMETTRRSGSLGHAIMAAEDWLRRQAFLPFGIRALLSARRPG